MIDALRFELGVALERQLAEDGVVEIRPALAPLPSVTPVGMASLLPGAGQQLRLANRDGGLVPMLGARVGDGSVDANHFVMSADKLGMRGDFAKFAGPLSLAAYRNGLQYNHGGASLQECVVTVITMQLKAPSQPNLTKASVSLSYKI